MVSFARVPPRRRRSPDGSDSCASLAFSMPLGLVSGLISGRPGPPFSRAISSRSAATSRRSSAPSSKSFNTKLLSSAGESASMSGGDTPPSSQKTDDSGILPSPHESIRRTYRQASVRQDFCPCYTLSSFEGLSQGSVLGDVFAEPLDERPQADLRHVRDQLVEHTALPEQRMGPVFGRVDLEMAIHAEAFAGGAEQRQENDGEGVQEKKPVAPLRIGDAKPMPKRRSWVSRSPGSIVQRLG